MRVKGRGFELCVEVLGKASDRRMPNTGSRATPLVQAIADKMPAVAGLIMPHIAAREYVAFNPAPVPPKPTRKTALPKPIRLSEATLYKATAQPKTAILNPRTETLVKPP